MSENWFLVVAILELVLTLLWFPPLWRYSIPVKTTQTTLAAPLVLDVATLATASEAIGADLVFRQR